MDHFNFVHNANLERFRHLIAESERNPNRDEKRHQMLRTLLAEEEAKDRKPPGEPGPTTNGGA